MRTNFQHDKTDGHDEWLTPPEIITALGPFDLDPCAPVVRPWPTAGSHYTIKDDGLSVPHPWFGFVWLNPPYGTQTFRWMRQMARHDHGIALIYARTDTRAFFECVWQRASCIRFIKGRLTFYDVTGKPAEFKAGAPTCLVGYGMVARVRLIERTLPFQSRFIDLIGMPNPHA